MFIYKISVKTFGTYFNNRSGNSREHEHGIFLQVIIKEVFMNTQSLQIQVTSNNQHLIIRFVYEYEIMSM